MKKVLIVSNNSGGGHQQTARILTQTLAARGWTPETVSIYHDLFPDYFRIFGVDGEQIYNKLILTKEMSRLVYGIFFFGAYHLIIRRHQQRLSQTLANYWQQKQPDLVISVIPLMNQVIARSLTHLGRTVPFVIVQTDLFEFPGKYGIRPRGTWFVSDDRTYTVVGTEEAYRQVLTAYTSDRTRVFKLSGTIIDSSFLDKPAFDRSSERQALDLVPEKMTGLFLYGGYAPNRVLKMAQALNRLGAKGQFIFVCGRNEGLQQQLSSLNTQYNKLVVGYTANVAYYMHLSDFLIGKAGPGVIMEGLATNLPLLIDASHQGIIHELPNVDWVEHYGFGVRFKNTEQLLHRIQQFISSHPTVKSSPWGYDQLKKNVTRFENKAILELPNLLDSIVSLSSVNLFQSQPPIGP